MNKKTIRIAGWALGLSMVVAGIGVAALNGAKAPIEAKAAEGEATITATGGTNASDAVVIVDNQSTERDAIKVGTSKLGGNMKIIVPAGAKHLRFHAAAWNGVTGLSLNLTGATASPSSFALTADSGVASNSPFTLAYSASGFNDEDDYLFTTSLSGVDTETTITLTSSIAKRFVVWGATYDDIGDSPIASIALDKGTVKTDYYVGDSVSTVGVKAIATLENSSTADVTSDCTITVSPATVTAGLEKVTYSAIYTGSDGEHEIANLDVPITATPVVVTSLSEYGTIKKDFNQNEVFSLGAGKIQANKNNSTYERFGLEKEGVTVSIGGVDYTGKNYYLDSSDAGKAVVLGYAGCTLEYTIGTITVPDEPASGHYELVISESGLAAGSKYVIVNSKDNGAGNALSTTQNTNNRGVASVTISNEQIATITASVQEITLVDTSSTVSGTYGLQVGANQYLAAASSGSNHLKTTALDSNACFQITFSSKAASLVAQGSYTHNTIRYNSGSNIFSCYASGQLDVYLYKFVSEEKDPSQVKAEKYVDDYLHFDTVGLNDHSDTNACRANGSGSQGWYETAKTAFWNNEVLSNDDRAFFLSSEVFKIARGRERLSAWAVANKETFNTSTGVFAAFNATSIRMNEPQENKGSNFPLIITIVAASAIVSGGLFFLQRKHRKED